MRKIAIVTIVSDNYGNRLQNLALQQVLLELGYKCETLKREKKGIKQKVRSVFRRAGQFLLQSKGFKYYQFSRRIHWSPVCLSQDQIPEGINERYDFFLTGSDQIWNPNFDFVGENELLTFALHEKRIAYAGSFGISAIPTQWKERYQKGLSEIPDLSVREYAGQYIIQELLGRKVPVVLDPTLLLTREFWYKVEKKPAKNQLIASNPNNELKRADLGKHYILMYFLGEMPAELNNLIKNCMSEDLCQMINIMDINKEGRQLPIGPAEFIWLIDHAQLFITDSFHGTAFSINMHTPFIVLDRKIDGNGNMNSRFDTILSEFQLKNHRYQDPGFDINKIMSVSFTKVTELQEQLTKKSLDFLKEALGQKEEREEIRN